MVVTLGEYEVSIFDSYERGDEGKKTICPQALQSCVCGWLLLDRIEV